MCLSSVNGQSLARLSKELEDGTIGALFVAGLNPAYELSGTLSDSLSKANLIVSFAERPDETTALAHYVCPDHHFLESWGDAEALDGVVSLRQPMIRPLRNSRALIESLNTWVGSAQTAYNTIREHWETNIQPRSNNASPFRAFWDATLHDGFTRVRVLP